MAKIILAVDDEPNIRLLLRQLLGKDYRVLEAIDGMEATNIAHTERPDLILMDIMMPGTDGYTACSRLKSDPATKDIPVIMLTGLDFELNKKLAEQIGAAGYITKPIDSLRLLEIVKNTLSA